MNLMLLPSIVSRGTLGENRCSMQSYTHLHSQYTHTDNTQTTYTRARTHTHTHYVYTNSVVMIVVFSQGFTTDDSKNNHQYSRICYNSVSLCLYVAGIQAKLKQIYFIGIRKVFFNGLFNHMKKKKWSRSTKFRLYTEHELGIPTRETDIVQYRELCTTYIQFSIYSVP